jgi:hypothetical protein
MFRNICKAAIRTYSTFKRPSPGYMFKRPIVDTDLNPPYRTPKSPTTKFDCENENWTGKELYKPKYGNSHYEYQDKEVWKEKK